MSIFSTIYYYISDSMELRIKEKLKYKIKKSSNKLSEKYKETIKEIKRTHYYSGKKSRKYFKKIESALIKSNIQKHIKFLTVEVFIIISIILGIIAFSIIYYFTINIPTSTVLAITVYSIPKLILNIIIHQNNNKIDTQLLYYCSTLANFCCSNDNIIKAMKNTDEFLQGPLKNLNRTFISEISHGLNVYKAFKNYGEKVDNKRFKNFIKNLQLCYQHNGSYIEVLKINHEIFENYQIEQEKRKKIVQNGRLSIIFIMIMGLIIAKGLININPTLTVMLQTKFTGQLIVTSIVIVYIYSIYKCITLEKFNI